MNLPGRSYDNPLTRAIANLSATNEQLRAGAVVTGEPLPSSRSAAVGREAVALPPLTIEERAALDAKAAELGFGPAAEEQGPYGSFEAAAAAGAPVEQEYVPQADRAYAAITGRDTARVVEIPRLPNFQNIGGIDLIRDVVYIDGMEFPITKTEGDAMRQFAVNTAYAFVMDQMNAAMAAFRPKEVTREAVSEVQGDEGDGRVL